MKRFVFNTILTFFILLSACSSNDNSGSDSEESINLETAKLTDFPFEEIDYTNIKITQPVISNNEETTEGEIIITLPHTVTSLSLSLKSVNIDTEKFNVFPSVGNKELFSETDFIKYTITSKNNPDKTLHYNVKIIIEENPKEEILSLTNFELLANDNSAFTDIDLIKKSKLQTIDSLIICLFPASINFSELAPAIKYKGSNIEYRINDNDFKKYPVDTGETINFKYPNTVDFKISNSTNSTSTTYRIIVDTKHPISFNEAEITIPDLLIGNTYNGTGVATWVNQGNYPITTMSPNEYTNVVTPATGLNNIFAVTLSKNSGGNINPNEEGTVNITITETPLIGEYKVSAIYHLNFNQNSWILVNSPTDSFIGNFGYSNVELNVKGNIIE